MSAAEDKARKKKAKGAQLSKKEKAALQARYDARNARLRFAATHSCEEALASVNSSLEGLSDEQVDDSRSEFGDNEVTRQKRKPLGQRLTEAFINPFTVVLLILAVVSCFTDIVFPLFSLFGNTPEDFNPTTVIIIAVMVIISGILRFVQETRSGDAAERLLDMISTDCTVVRQESGQQEIDLDEAVVGDILKLSVGDMVPADCRILEAKDLFINQSSLTGESEACEKLPDTVEGDVALTECDNLAFMGTNVISGSATVLALATGDDTMFGAITARTAGEAVETSFSKGVNSVTWVLIRFMCVMVPTVFVINGLTKGDWLQALLFSISIAVGLTPEMLPMIVTTCLAKGAVSMSKKKTVVKNLNSIQNFGAIDILCTDKTGTLTQDQVVLQYNLNVMGEEDSRVLRHAFLNSYFQTGYRNLMDKAIITKNEFERENNHPEWADLTQVYKKVDEIPFEFSRRRLSVVVEDKGGKRQMVTKGAVEEMLAICTHAEYKGKIIDLDKPIRKEILRTVDELNDQGFRVLAVAQKNEDLPPEGVLDASDERNMVLIGYLAFLDPPKETTAEAIDALKKHGVTTKILTGDNDRVARTICRMVGLEVSNILLGSDIENMPDRDLSEVVERTQVFAKLSPDQKVRVVAALRDNGHAVGFMGDGINDAPAMKASDVAISVDSTVDIAKESADIILLEKDLMVLEEGIVEGRKTYANMIKYIKMTASSNFGNMFSVLVASALLPFLPMQSLHLIILNLIYDLSCTVIPWDNVDEEFLLKPREWNASSVTSFMIWIGPTSSIFDFTTYLFLYFVFCPMLTGGVTFNDLGAVYSGQQLLDMQTAYVALFNAGWFVESMWTQTLVIHMIRTPKLPFVQSRASAPLMLVTLAGIAVLTSIPYTPIGPLIGLSPLPITFYLYLIPCVLLYMLLATSIKWAYTRHFGELL